MIIVTGEHGDLLSLLDTQTPGKHHDTRRESVLHTFGVRMNRHEEQVYTE